MNTVMTPELNFESWLKPTGPVSATEPQWLTEVKQLARDQVQREGVPNRKAEDWRYTSLDKLLQLPLERSSNTLPKPDLTALDGLFIPGLPSYRFVLLNGHYRSDLSRLTDLPPAVRAESLKTSLQREPEIIKQHLNRILGANGHVFSALNTAGLNDGLFLSIPDGVALDRPIELIHINTETGTPLLSQSRHLVTLGQDTQATLIERHLGSAGTVYCSNTLVELELGEDCRLTHYRVQQESRSAYHLSGLFLQQDRGSRYQQLTIALGAAWSRTDIRLKFQGEEASSDIQGFSLAGDSQLTDVHLDLCHEVPACRSQTHFRGVLQGASRSVFDGRIYVAKAAQHTDARLNTASLILSEKAEVDTKPQLEIFADDVKCSHGATVGQLDPDAVFYLRSRGIPAASARQMLCVGFAAEIIDACELPALKSYITQQVEQHLLHAINSLADSS